MKKLFTLLTMLMMTITASFAGTTDIGKISVTYYPAGPVLDIFFDDQEDVVPSWSVDILLDGKKISCEMGQEWNEIYAYPSEQLAHGKHTIVFPAGSLMLNSSTTNDEECSAVFVVADFPTTISQKPLSDYSTTNAEFQLSKIAAAFGTDAATLASALNGGSAQFGLFNEEGQLISGTNEGVGSYWMKADGTVTTWGPDAVAFNGLINYNATADKLIIPIGQNQNAFTGGEAWVSVFTLKYGGVSKTLGVLLNITKEEVNPLAALAQPVIDLIDAIGEVNLISSKKIVAAREAYDALSEEVQAYVTNYEALLAAEALYQDMLDFNDYRTICATGLSWVVGPFDRAEIGDIAAEAVLKLMQLQYQPDLTLEQNKQNVYEIFDAYRKVLFQKRGDLAHATIFADAKEAAKLNIMLFLGISDSQSARDAAEAGKAAIDALEYDDETDVINNIEEIQDIVIDTKINIVKAWMADFEDFKDVIRNIIGISPQLESISYDKELTYNENIAKLEAVREAAAGSATSIESIGADSAKPMKYIENGKLVIVKNGSKYAANGAIIK